MAKKKTEVATREVFVIEMPDEAPPLGFDPNGDGFTWRDVLPQNYMNLDWLEEKQELLGGNPILTPSRIVIQPVIDPEDNEPDLTPKLVLEFVESVPALVLNRTRCTLLTKLAGTPNPARWIGNLAGRQLELYPGAARDFSAALQILLRPVNANGNGKAADVDVDAVNEELFG